MIREKSDFSVFVADHLEKLLYAQHKEEETSKLNKWIARMNDLDFKKRTRTFLRNFTENLGLLNRLALSKTAQEPCPETYPKPWKTGATSIVISIKRFLFPSTLLPLMTTLS